ncbi:MAG: glycosyltransferase [Tannerella sp.]|nr:glycosyltransferase [Tannerella sp.]
MNTPYISVIVSIYNSDRYLSRCLDSLISQNGNFEFILIDNGSTDKSISIISHYLDLDNRIKVIYQHDKNNIIFKKAGIEQAKGKYIVFIGANNYLTDDSLAAMHNYLSKYEVDIVMVSSILGDKLPAYLKHGIISGKQLFIEIMKSGFHIHNYTNCCLYNLKWLQDKQLVGNEKVNVQNNDLWVPQVLFNVEKAVVTDMKFFHYSDIKEAGSEFISKKQQLYSIFRITANYLVLFKSCTENENCFKSWIYVKILALYEKAFAIACRIKDASFILPKHHLYSFCRIYRKLEPEPRDICSLYYKKAQKSLRDYHLWRINSKLPGLPVGDIDEKIIILVYNNPKWYSLSSIPLDDLPANIYITTNREYFQKAHVVIFCLHTLNGDLDGDIEKQAGQLWVAWTHESEDTFTWFKNKDFIELFDIRMTHHLDSDVFFPYMEYEYIDLLSKQVDIRKSQNKICMMVSSTHNHSKRVEYLSELMKYTEIDSYGKLYNNKSLMNDYGRASKIELYAKYKFVIAFENSISRDYVTEKFFDPLISGSVPVYLGAPNVQEFAPGNNCFVDVTQFLSPRHLADYINACYSDEKLYNKHHLWRREALFSGFTLKVEPLKTNLFIRLSNFIVDKFTR